MLTTSVNLGRIARQLIAGVIGAALLAGCGQVVDTAPVQTGLLPTLQPTNTPVPAPALSLVGRDEYGRTPVTARLVGSGSTFANPIYTSWIPQFNRTSPNVKIEYQSIGSGRGRSALLGTPVAATGNVTPAVPNDFAGSDAPFRGDELNKASTKGDILHIPVAVGAVVAVYNLREVPALRLSGPVLADIYTGKITRWNDPAIKNDNTSVSLPDKEIRVVIRNRTESSGTSEIFSRYLAVVSDNFRTTVGPGSSPRWTVKTAAEGGRALEGEGNDGVANAVKTTDGAIGYVDQGVADENKLTYAAIRNKTGRFIQPTPENVSAAAAGSFIADDFRNFVVDAEGVNSYPITGFTWLISWRDLGLMPAPSREKAQAMVAFMWWALHEGQRNIPKGYAPLPEAVIPRLERLFISDQPNAEQRVFIYQGKPILQ